MTKKLPNARTSEILVQEAGDDILLYDLQINKAFCLNETSRMVWQLCDGKNSVAEIAGLIGKQLKMDVSEEFVWLALDSLKKDNLLENAAEFAINFGGLNRRDVIRKVGLASMVMLPLISSVVAPSALMAQSGGCNPNQLCPTAFGGDPICCPDGTDCLGLGKCCPGGAAFCDNTDFCCPSGLCALFVCCPPSATFTCGTSCCSAGQTCDPFEGFCF